MLRGEYIGPDPELRGKTALLQDCEDCWLVQVDDLERPEAYGWQRFEKMQWKILEVSCDGDE